jgi:site-specific recombinase XerD
MDKKGSLQPSFTFYLQGFLSDYAVGRLSPNTVAGYADTFRLLFSFFENRSGADPQKFGFDDFNRDFVLRFLEWLKVCRHCSDATVNQRMYALHAFCRYMQYKRPEYLASFGAILSIPKRKNHPKIPRYLNESQTKALLEAPDSSTPEGYRDMVMLCTLYEAALRVSELTALNAVDVKFGHYPFIDVMGKGSKPRRVFISKKLEKILCGYLAAIGCGTSNMEAPLFRNQWGKRISRFGVGYVLKKYYRVVSGEGFPDSLSPHGLRQYGE